MTEPNCRDCAFCGNDPDGLYCAHETSRKATHGFCWGIIKARNEEFPCGPQGTYFERAPEEVLLARGRS